MSRYLGDPDFAHDRPPCTGLLLVNLGTPEAPTTAAVRRFLAEFLADPRVIELPRPLWRLLLHGVVLRIRPRRSAAAYRAVWQAEGSPLLAIAERQAAALARELAARGLAPVEVALGMRYGRPSVREALEGLHAAGARRLLVLPLYPQYSATTTGSTFDAVSAVLSGWRWLPELRFLTHYHDHPPYLDALAASVRERWRAQGPSERLLFSFHGLPKRYFLAGDPYYCQCHKTARLVAERLALPDETWALAFQSRVGREPWLAPYTDEMLPVWAREGVRSVTVLCPGFSADCLETLEEVDIRYRELFLESGGERFDYVPALNDRAEHVRALADLVAAQLAGWQEHVDEVELEARAGRARARGAAR